MLERASSVRRNSTEGLAERRRSRRRSARIAFLLVLTLLLSATVYGLQQDYVRISSVQTFGTKVDLADYVKKAMGGYYFGIVPRDSYFFIPRRQIRSSILADHPEFAAVSISHLGINSISVKATERTPVVLWCGVAVSDKIPECYVLDPGGLIFAIASTTSSAKNKFILYAPISSSSSSPLLSTVENFEKVSQAFELARRLGAMNVSISTMEVVGDEVTYTLISGAKIVYILGNEQTAITAIVSAGANVDLTDPSIEYIDLRFNGKIYLKKKVDSVQKEVKSQ